MARVRKQWASVQPTQIGLSTFLWTCNPTPIDSNPQKDADKSIIYRYSSGIFTTFHLFFWGVWVFFSVQPISKNSWVPPRTSFFSAKALPWWPSPPATGRWLSWWCSAWRRWEGRWIAPRCRWETEWTREWRVAEPWSYGHHDSTMISPLRAWKNDQTWGWNWDVPSGKLT